MSDPLPPQPPRHPIRRYLFFLVVITVAVVGGEQLFEFTFLNTTGRTEAQRALREHPDLAQRLGRVRLGFAWRGHDDWYIPGPATAVIYMPVRGEHASGTLYLREEGHGDSWTLRRLSFRETGSPTWTLY